jgi:site-specific recombinase XerD
VGRIPNWLASDSPIMKQRVIMVLACGGTLTGLELTKNSRPSDLRSACHAASVGSLRFHDLQHMYATWLVSEGVPVNDVASVLGQEQTSTTPNRYTHASRDRHALVRSALANSRPRSRPHRRRRPLRGGVLAG